MVGVKSKKLKRIYNDQDKEIFLKNFGKISNRDIAVLIGCNSELITIWRRKMGLPRRNVCWNTKKLNKLKENSLSYIAGLIDGEGHLSLARSKGRILSPRLNITNTNESLIDYLIKTLGVGTKYVHGEEKRLKSNRKKCYIYSLALRDILKELLRKLDKYLIIKKQHARVIIEFIKIREKRLRRDEKTGRFLPYKETKREWEIYYKLRKLNERGLKNAKK